MILGIGTDLCEIVRIQRALERYGDRFARRILMDAELPRLRRHRKPAAYLAKRFAAKEAFSKAMGTGIRHPVTWQNVGVLNAPSGEPRLIFTDALQLLLNARRIVSAHVSLTDETGMASAFVILEGMS
ncbi:MAG: holo-ACP synthase [Betaproteobacteria bacterium]|nr:holo-ACP synthase [Betaproteobacteria bacterium]